MTDLSEYLIIEDIDKVPAVDAKTAVILKDAGRPDLLDQTGYIYPNGAIRNGQGHYLVRPPYSNRAFTGDSARAAVQKRETLRSEAVQAAIIAGTVAKPGDLAGGVQALAGALVAIVTKKSSQDRDKIAAFKELMRFGGLAGDLGRGGQGAAGPGPAPGLSSEAVAALNVILPVLESKIKHGE